MRRRRNRESKRRINEAKPRQGTLAQQVEQARWAGHHRRDRGSSPRRAILLPPASILEFRERFDQCPSRPGIVCPSRVSAEGMSDGAGTVLSARRVSSTGRAGGMGESHVLRSRFESAARHPVEWTSPSRGQLQPGTCTDLTDQQARLLPHAVVGLHLSLLSAASVGLRDIMSVSNWMGVGRANSLRAECRGQGTSWTRTTMDGAWRGT